MYRLDTVSSGRTRVSSRRDPTGVSGQKIQHERQEPVRAGVLIDERPFEAVLDVAPCRPLQRIPLGVALGRRRDPGQTPRFREVEADQESSGCPASVSAISAVIQSPSPASTVSMSTTSSNSMSACSRDRIYLTRGPPGTPTPRTAVSQSPRSRCVRSRPYLPRRGRRGNRAFARCRGPRGGPRSRLPPPSRR